jgi:protease IV
VVLRLETGGGSVAASQEISALIQEFPKPLVVSMGDVTASGGYYISSHADWIVAQPGTLTGSIGVIWATFDIEGLLDKLGIEMDAITAGEHKDMALPGRLTPERRAIVQEMVDEIYDQFVDEIARGRPGLTREEVLPLATGQLFTGSQAFQSGLVDELGGLPTAIAKAEELAGIQDAEIIEFRPSLWEAMLMGPGFGAFRWPVQSGPSVQGDLEALKQFLDGYAVPRFGG